MLLDGLGWSHYSVFSPCIMTQTRVLGRSGGGLPNKLTNFIINIIKFPKIFSSINKFSYITHTFINI